MQKYSNIRNVCLRLFPREINCHFLSSPFFSSFRFRKLFFFFFCYRIKITIRLFFVFIPWAGVNARFSRPTQNQNNENIDKRRKVCVYFGYYDGNFFLLTYFFSFSLFFFFFRRTHKWKRRWTIIYKKKKGKRNALGCSFVICNFSFFFLFASYSFKNTKGIRLRQKKKKELALTQKNYAQIWFQNFIAFHISFLSYL